MTRCVPRIRALRIDARRCPVVRRMKPVGAPLPHVPGRVVEAVAVGREGVHRGCPRVAVGQRVLGGEAALEDVHPVLAARLALTPPRVVLPLEAASRRVLPLGLGRKPRAAPGAELAGVGPRDVHHGMPVASVDAPSAAPPDGASPRRTPAATRAPPRPRASGGSRPAGGRRRRTTTRTARLRSRTRSGRQSGRRARSSRRTFRCGTRSAAPRGPALRRRRDTHRRMRSPSRSCRPGSRRGRTRASARRSASSARPRPGCRSRRPVPEHSRVCPPTTSSASGRRSLSKRIRSPAHSQRKKGGNNGCTESW